MRYSINFRSTEFTTIESELSHKGLTEAFKEIEKHYLICTHIRISSAILAMLLLQDGFQNQSKDHIWTADVIIDESLKNIIVLNHENSYSEEDNNEIKEEILQKYRN